MATKLLYLDRLEDLVVVLKGLEEEAFDISCFYVRSNESSCGSVGCLVGWYCVKRRSSWLAKVSMDVTYNDGVEDICFSPLQWRYVDEYFGLERCCGAWLFDCDLGPSTRDEAIGRVEVVIRAMKGLKGKEFRKWQNLLPGTK